MCPSPPTAAVGSPPAGPPMRSPITTHVLDTAVGRPAPAVHVTLARRAPGSAAAWEQVAVGRTNKDGRVPDLLPPADWVQAGHYRITWDTAEYMARCSAEHPAFFTPTRRFYPSVSVEFEIQPHQVGRLRLSGRGMEPLGCRLRPPAAPGFPNLQALAATGAGTVLLVVLSAHTLTPPSQCPRSPAAVSRALPRAAHLEPVRLQHVPRQLSGLVLRGP